VSAVSPLVGVRGMTHAMTHELRVLDGLHAGARAPLPAATDGALRLAIGSALDNDIVLSDPGVQARHAVLHWNAEAGRWHLLDDGQAPADGGHPPGVALTVGPVRVTVAAANDPFDLTASPPVAPEPEPDPEPVAEEHPAADASPLDERPGAPAEQIDAGTPPAASAAGPSRLVTGALLGGGTAVLLLVGASLWLFAQGSRPKAVTAVPAASRAVADLRATVAALLQRRGLDSRLALQGDARQARVSGLLAGASELEPLAADLGRLQPRPSMQVWTLEQVRGALRDGGLKLPPSVSLAVDDQGRLRLGGALPSDDAERALPRAVRALLPPFITVSAEFEPPAALAQRFIADARTQGFALDGQVQGRQLLLRASIADADLPRWERWLLGAQQRLSGLLSLSVQLRPPAAPAPAAPRRLPFTVASVVGGPQPYVVLADGTRLVPGARRDGLTLVEIEPESLVLQGPGPAFKVPR
jgi:type III secretion protein D